MDDGGCIHNRDFEEVTTLLAQSTPSASTPGIPLNSKLVFNLSFEGRWTGFGVAVHSGMVPFLQSLNPSYLPPNTQQKSVNGPAFTLGSNADGDLIQGVELAARLVSPCAGLPEEISNLLGSAFSAAPVLRFAWDQWTAISDSASKEEPTDYPGKNDKEKAKVPADGPQQADKTAVAAMGAGQLPKAAVALGAMSCLATTKAQSSIEVADTETLGKIGRDPNYPLNGSYRQSSDIDGSGLSRSIGNRSHPFTGQYDGQCHTIDNLQRCLVQTMDDGGHVDSLRFTGANINSTETTGVVACEILDNAVASNIQVEHAFVATSGEEKFAGIGAGYVRGAVTNMTVVNGTVTTSGAGAHAGISAGKLAGNSSLAAGTGALSCKVSVSGKGTDAGVGAGHVINGTVSNTMAAHSRVEALREGAAGIGAGFAQRGVVAKTTAAYCHVNAVGGSDDETGTAAIGVGTASDTEVVDTIAVHCEVEGGRSAIAGIGAGEVQGGTVVRVAVVNGQVKSYKSCGIGAGSMSMDGQASLSNTTSVNSTVSAQDSAESIYAGIGVGQILYSGTVSNTTGVDSKIVTLKAQARVGIGAGSLWRYGSKTIRHTVSVNCEVITSSPGSKIGIGAGFMRDGTIVFTTALSSGIRGNGSSLGIGAGEKGDGAVDHVRAIDCTMADVGDSASIDLGANLERCNLRVNGEKQPDSPFACDYSFDNLCQYTAPGLLAKDCKPNNRLLTDIHQALKNIRHSQPLQPDFLNPQQITQFGVCWTRSPPPTVVTGANYSVPVTQCSLPAANGVAGANNTVSVVPCWLPGTAAPLTTGLSAGAVAGIALGAVAACALVAGGAYAYYRYNRSGNSEGKGPVSP